MENEYKLPMKNFTDADIEPKEGETVALSSPSGGIVNALIKKVEKDTVTLVITTAEG